jgi:hypothetical protein
MTRELLGGQTDLRKAALTGEIKLANAYRKD